MNRRPASPLHPAKGFYVTGADLSTTCLTAGAVAVSGSEIRRIGLTALLSLVEWIEARRIKSQQGGPSCDDHQSSVSPPAPDRAEGVPTAGPALAGSDRRPAAANAPGAQPRRGSSTGGTSGRKGGGA